MKRLRFVRLPLKGFGRLMRSSFASRGWGSTYETVGLSMVSSCGWCCGCGPAKCDIEMSLGSSYPWIVESGDSVVARDGGSVSVKVSDSGLGSGFGVGGTYNEFWVLRCDP